MNKTIKQFTLWFLLIVTVYFSFETVAWLFTAASTFLNLLGLAAIFGSVIVIMLIIKQIKKTNKTETN